MLVKEALTMACRELEDFTAKHLEARILLANVLNLTQESLLMNYNQEIPDDKLPSFISYIERRKLFEPIAYIIGKKEFYGLDFLLDQNVLIPKPDTETLVDKVIEEYTASRCEQITLLELGTGSGALAVTLAFNILAARITATDISDNVLAIAAGNAALHKVEERIEFIKSDWYKDLNVGKFDYVVSNPPYICYNEKYHMAKETLMHEPPLALFANGKGLAHYHRIIGGAPRFLNNNGRIFLEIGFNQAEAVRKILEKHQFTNIRNFPDLAGRSRVIAGTLKNYK